MLVEKDWVEEYKKWWLGQGHTLTSTLMYVSVIRRYVGDKGIELDQKTVDKFRESHMNTVSSGALKSFFRFLVRKKQFDDSILNIRFDRNKQTKRFPKSISQDEVTILINNMPSLKTKVLTLFTFELALRISESLKVRWDDFNWLEWASNKDEWGKVNLLNTKRGKFRTIPVNPQLMNLLYSLCSQKSTTGLPLSGIVFNFDLDSFIPKTKNDIEQAQHDYLSHSSGYYRDVLEKVSKQHLGKKVTPHWLRHSKSQQLLDGGVSLDGLKNFLGHQSISSTEIYAQASPKKVEKELKEFELVRKLQNK